MTLVGLEDNYKQHLLSTYCVQGTLPDGTKDTKIDETQSLPPSAHESPVRPCFNHFLSKNNTDQG